MNESTYLALFSVRFLLLCAISSPCDGFFPRAARPVVWCSNGNQVRAPLCRALRFQKFILVPRSALGALAGFGPNKSPGNPIAIQGCPPMRQRGKNPQWPFAPALRFQRRHGERSVTSRILGALRRHWGCGCFWLGRSRPGLRLSVWGGGHGDHF